MIKKQFKSLQKLIDRCVKHDYDTAKDALSMKMSYLSGEQRPDYIRKEIFRVTEELVAMNQKVPALQTFAFDWKMPNFIWESAFNENLTIAERKKYIAFLYDNFDERQYIENPTSYDEQLPYFSTIVKMVAYSRYLEDLQKEEQERIPSPATTTNPAAESKENIPSKKIVGKENPFNCNLNKEAIWLLTNCINEAHIFTTEVTSEILEDFFYCRLDGALKSDNNRLLAYLMTQLSLYRYITYEWQSVIANNKLLLAPMKDKYINRSVYHQPTTTLSTLPPRNRKSSTNTSNN